MSDHRTIVRAALAMVAITLALTAGLGGVHTPVYGQQQEEQQPATAPTEAQPAQDEARIQVGTYDLQYVFRGYPVDEQATEQLSQARNVMLQAHQEGDQQAMMQAQQQMQQHRQQIIQQFEQAVEQALPEVVEQTGVDLVALRVVYQDEDVRTVDIGDALIEAMGGELPEPQPQMTPAPQTAPQTEETPESEESPESDAADPGTDDAATEQAE